jgi:penicillin-insensitive murein endopeptidase
MGRLDRNLVAAAGLAALAVWLPGVRADRPRHAEPRASGADPVVSRSDRSAARAGERRESTAIRRGGASTIADAPVDSVSIGLVNRGALSDARELPVEGSGYVVPEPWRSRGLRYGTDELVRLVTRAAARVAREQPGGQLAVADLSKEHGGTAANHRSHQSGRDVDLVFYALSRDGSPLAPDGRMPGYSPDGRASERRGRERYFDLPRNWALVRALLEDREATVIHIFVSRRVRSWLLAYAQVSGEPAALVERASHILSRPTDVGGHNDHMHVRIACGSDDVTLGGCGERLAEQHRERGYIRLSSPD